MSVHWHGRVLDNLKDYSVKALVNAVDHLGTVAFKLNDLISLQNEEIDHTQLAASTVAQVLVIYKPLLLLSNSSYTMPD